ncbi:hypothetical protein NC652_036683 [Populus alba x Populus x berolinensis]|nr:hypothetical protein NC652_036683 [Populus alba x Populus x berolinensis]
MALKPFQLQRCLAFPGYKAREDERAREEGGKDTKKTQERGRKKDRTGEKLGRKQGRTERKGEPRTAEKQTKETGKKGKTERTEKNRGGREQKRRKRTTSRGTNRNRKEEDDRTRKAETEERKQCWWNSPSTPSSSFAKQQIPGTEGEGEKRERPGETRNQEGGDIVRPELTLRLHPVAAPLQQLFHTVSIHQFSIEAAVSLSLAR